MNGSAYLIFAVLVGLSGAVVINQANADLVSFLYQTPNNHAYNTSDVDTSRVERLRAQKKSRLTIVKIGSHVLRKRLLDVGCWATSGEFVKCREDVLQRELASFDPVR